MLVQPLYPPVSLAAFDVFSGPWGRQQFSFMCGYSPPIESKGVWSGDKIPQKLKQLANIVYRF